MTLLAPHIANKLGLLMDVEARNSANPSLTPDEIKAYFGLTDRECEIIAMLSTGIEDHIVVDELCISGSTFKKHLYNACKKMGISSRTQLFNALLAARESAAKQTRKQDWG